MFNALSSSNYAHANYSTKPVFTQKTPKGFDHNFYIMFHATDAANVQSILTSGFRKSKSGRLGAGVYCSLDMNKAKGYGNVILKLLVYAGKTLRCTSLQPPSNWQNDYASCWVPPNTPGWTKEENCTRDPKQIKVLGIMEGVSLVPPTVQTLTTDKANSSTTKLSKDELEILYDLCTELQLRVKPPGKRVNCKYGASCYRKNQEHLTEFAHPNDKDWES